MFIFQVNNAQEIRLAIKVEESKGYNSEQLLGRVVTVAKLSGTHAADYNKYNEQINKGSEQLSEKGKEWVNVAVSFINEIAASQVARPGPQNGFLWNRFVQAADEVEKNGGSKELVNALYNQHNVMLSVGVAVGTNDTFRGNIFTERYAVPANFDVKKFTLLKPEYLRNATKTSTNEPAPLLTPKGKVNQ